MVCDKKIVLELVGDIIKALSREDSLEAYRYYSILEGYVKRNKCGGDVIETVIKFLKSSEHTLSESMRIVLVEIEGLVSKLKRKSKKKSTERKSKRKSKSRTRGRRKH